MHTFGSPQAMPRRDFLKFTATAAASTAALRLFGAETLPTPGGRKHPNIVFVFSDEHRWCSMPFTDMPEVSAPNMARLAEQGVSFDNCISGNPICTPYRGMLITGLWPHRSSCVSNDTFYDHDIIGKKSPTIAQTFKAAGYATGYIGKWHLSNETCAHAGFDSFQHWLYGDEHMKTEVRDVTAGEDFHTVEGYNATGMTDQALAYLRAQAGGAKPFLLMLSINPPHWRWDDAPQEFVDLYPDENLPFRPNVTEEEARTDKRLLYYRHYHAHISAVDRELGRLTDELDKLGIAGDTVFIYTSDHGSSFGSNGVSNKSNPFDEAIRVPFLARWPGHIPAGKTSDRLLNTIDLYPTLCGLAGIPKPKHCDGQDFSAALLGKGGPDPDTALIHVVNFKRSYYWSVLEPDQEHSVPPFRGVRGKRYTFVVGAAGDWLLFDNRNDPYQRVNLVDDPAHAQVKERLRGELQRWLEVSEDPFIPEEWTKLSIPQRIAEQNRAFTLLPYQEQWDQLKAQVLAPHLADATPAQRAALKAAADRVFDADYFGPFKAYDNELHPGHRRWTKIPFAEIHARLEAHETAHVERFAEEVRRIMGTTSTTL